MYVTANPTPHTGLEESVRIALDYPQPSILESLARRMDKNRILPADVVICALELLCNQPTEQWAAQLPSLLALAEFLEIDAQTLINGGLQIAYHSDQRERMGKLIWAIANAAGLSQSEFALLIQRVELEMQLNGQRPNSSQSSLPAPATMTGAVDSVTLPVLPTASPEPTPLRQNPRCCDGMVSPPAILQTQSESDGDRLAADLEAFYCSPEVNIQIERYGAPIEGPRNWVCRFRSGRDPSSKKKRIAKLSELRKWKEELISEVGLPPGKIVIQSNAEDGTGWTEFICPKAKWEPCVFDQYEEQLCQDYSLTDHPELPIGVDFRGNLHWVKLKSLLVGGEPESGKSSFIKSLLAGMSLRYSPAFVQFQLVDLQEATFGHFDHYPWLWDATVTNGEALKSAFDAIVDEGATRQAEFAKYKVDKLADYIAESGKSYPYLILLIDELQLAREVLDAQIQNEIVIASEIGGDYEGKESFDDYLGYITRGLRKYGIYVVAATQRPEQTVVPKLVRDMFPLRLSFRVTSEGSSRVILGDRDRCENGAYLQGDGHCYLVEPKGEFWLQSLWIPKEDVIAIGKNGQVQFPSFVKQRKPKVRHYPNYPAAAASPVEPIEKEPVGQPAHDRDYPLFLKIQELEGLVREDPIPETSEIYRSEFLRRVFEMPTAPEGGTRKRLEKRVAQIKAKFAGRTSHVHS